MNKQTDEFPALTRRCFFGAAVAAAATAAEPQVSVPAYNTLTDAEEVALGRKFAASLEREVPILQVAPLQNYVQSLASALGRTSRRRNLEYRVKIVNTPDVNAVSLPGGYIFVYRGLLEAVRTESELVGVLGHEVGHVVGRHSANKLMLDFRARQVYEIVRRNLELQNTVIEQVLEKLGGPAVVLAHLQYGREMEYEADMLGVYNQIRAGWDPEGAVTFFRRLGLGREGGGDWTGDLLSTHPNPNERARRIQQEIAGLRLPEGLRRSSFAFEAMKMGLPLLPPPVRAPRRAS